MGNEIDDFLAEVLPELWAAERAMRDGDVARRLALWSRSEPVSWLGPFGTCAVGSDEVAAHFRRVAARFSDLGDFRFDLVAADVVGECAHVVGYERSTGRIDGQAPVAMTMRVSRAYRREGGKWRIAHGHGDLEPSSLNLPWKPPPI